MFSWRLKQEFEQPELLIKTLSRRVNIEDFDKATLNVVQSCPLKYYTGKASDLEL